MKERFSVAEIYICPVNKVGDKLKPDLEYPIRLCVIDNELEIAIDIKNNLKYDYVRTANHMEFINDSFKKIEGDKRVAIFPFIPICCDTDEVIKIKQVTDKLKRNEQFKDGNEVYNNKQYLEYLKQENLKQNNNKQKTKKRKK